MMALKSKLQLKLEPPLFLPRHKDTATSFICPICECKIILDKSAATMTRWKCFTCGASSDVIGLFREVNRCSYQTAIYKLNHQYRGFYVTIDSREAVKEYNEHIPRPSTYGQYNIALLDDFYPKDTTKAAIIEAFSHGIKRIYSERAIINYIEKVIKTNIAPFHHKEIRQIAHIWRQK